MKAVLIIGAYLSAGMSFTMFLMWCEAAHPELNLGGWDDGAVVLVSVIFWPLMALFIGIAFLCGFLGKLAQTIFELMKEDGEE